MNTTEPQVVLELHNVSKSFRDGDTTREVLKILDLKAHAGEFVAIVGPSGSGKSTLLNVAGIMLSPDHGEVLINGEDMATRPAKQWTAIRRQHIGFVFQNHQLLPYLTGRDQFSVVSPADQRRVAQLAEELDITEILDQYPSHMSGGERQRVAIARAFMSDPDIILADEPTASLDAARGHHVVEMIAMGFTSVTRPRSWSPTTSASSTWSIRSTAWRTGASCAPREALRRVPGGTGRGVRVYRPGMPWQTPAGEIRKDDDGCTTSGDVVVAGPGGCRDRWDPVHPGRKR